MAHRRAALLSITFFFVAAAPVYWRAVEEPHDPAGHPGVNAPLYVITGAPTSYIQPLYWPFLFLDTPTALAWIAALSLAVAGVGMALFMLGLGLRGSAALYAAVVYAFGGLGAGVMSRPDLACVLAWSPWVLAAAHALARKPHGARAVLAGIAAALTLHGGGAAAAAAWPSVTLGILIGLFAAVEESGTWRRPWTRSLGVCLVAALTAMVASVLMGWLGQHPPGYPLSMAAFTPGTATGILTHLTAAATNDLPHAGYYGVAALLLTPAALTRREGGLFCVLLGVAWAGALYDHAPTGWLIAAALCGATVAGLGADALLAPLRDWRSPFYYVPLACAIVIAALLLLSDDAVAGRVALLLLPMLMPALLRAPLVSFLATLLIVLLTVGDLAAANRNRFPHPYFGAPAHNAAHP